MTDDQLHAAIGRDLSNATSWDIAQICRNTGMEAYPHDETRQPLWKKIIERLFT